MEIVEGLEVAASAFFNGYDWMRDAEGRACGFLNFEEKKEADGGTGETCGEMGTTFFGCTEENELFREIIIRPQLKERLKNIGFHGVFDVNCIVTDEGRIVALEPTCRPGIPSTSYEFCEAIEGGVGNLIDAVARGKRHPVGIWQGWGMVMCLVAKPFPLEADVDDEATSIGERLWILKDGLPVGDLDTEQKKHIHLYNFKRDDEGLKVATKNGYLLTVTARGDEIAPLREYLIEYIKDNLMISGMKYRTDIGKRVEEYEDSTENDTALQTAV
jgi:phosphoribosylamine-glycine ligase